MFNNKVNVLRDFDMERHFKSRNDMRDGNALWEKSFRCLKNVLRNHVTLILEAKNKFHLAL